MQKLVVDLGESQILLKWEFPSEEFDLDELTKIQYDNIFGEMITISTLINRIGLLKSEVDGNFAEEKLTFSIYEAELRRLKKSEFIANGTPKPTIQDLEDALTLDPAWQAKKRKLLRLEKQTKDIDYIYWSIQSKSKKLESILAPVTPVEFERNLIEGKINQIIIKRIKKS